MSYAFIVNGSPNAYLHLSRGLRQGDSLSPYLFLLCAECLSTLMARKEEDRFIQGIYICQHAPSISHLLFEDDCLLYASDSHVECAQMSDVLKVYQRASRQMINFSNSVVCFSKNIKWEDQVYFARALGVSKVDHHDKYLGLPTVVG